MLPAVLAPYGSLSLLGWVFSGFGTICLALTIGAVSKRIPRLGGPYAYTQESLKHVGEMPCFLVGWGYWMSYWSGTTAGAIACVGYLGFFIPSLATDPIWGAMSAICIIWILTAVNVNGVRNAGIIQLITTLLKLMPLFLVASGGLFIGEIEQVEARNPDNQSMPMLISTLVLLTMWAYLGFENVSHASEDVIEPDKNIPKALITGTITATIVYIIATFSVMALVPIDELAISTSPFADAASVLFGPWGAGLIAAGAIISILGALNGNILVAGQLSRAIALDKFLPSKMAELNTKSAPAIALIVSGVFSTILVAMNFNKGLVSAFTIIILMSTLMNFIVYVGSSVTSLYLIKKDKDSGEKVSTGLVLVSMCGLVFTLFAMIGSGLEAALYSSAYLLLGIPVFLWMKSRVNE